MGYSEYKDPFEKTLVIDSSKLKEHCDSLAEILDYYKSLLPVKSDVVVAEKVEQQNAIARQDEAPFKQEWMCSDKFYFAYLMHWDYVTSQQVGHTFSTRPKHPITQKIAEQAMIKFGASSIYTVSNYCQRILGVLVADGLLKKIGRYTYVVLKSNASNGNR